MTTANSAGFTAEMALAEEVTAGTSPAISTALRDYFTGDPGINPVQDSIDPANVYGRHVVDIFLSDYHMEGNIPQIVTPNGHLGYWLGGAIGAESSAQQGGTAAYLHTYTPADAPKTYSMWYKRGGNQQVVIPYVVPNTLQLVQNLNDVLRMNVGMIGQKETINADSFASADAYDTIDAFRNADLTVTGPTNAAQTHYTEINFNNNYTVEQGKVHGSRHYSALVPGKRNVDGVIRMWFDDDGDYQSFWGSTSETTPDADGVYSTIPLVFTWDRGVLADTGYNYKLIITVPEAVFRQTSVNVDGRIAQTINWTARYDTGDSYEVKAELTNIVASYP